MRIDGSDADGVDPRTRFRLYVSAFRRRWILVLIPMVLGAVLGWFTAPSADAGDEAVEVPVTETVYYKATHVLAVETRGAGGDSGAEAPNLSQAAYLANTGQVPKDVAAELDIAEAEVQDSVIGFPRVEVNSVEVTAVGTDRDRVVAIADETAVRLSAEVKSQSESDIAEVRDAIVDELGELDRRITELNIQIADDPPNRPQLEAQQRSLTNEYSSVFEQFSALSSNPMEMADLVSLESARAHEISKLDYEELRRQIRDGAAYVTGEQGRKVEEKTDKGLTTPLAGAGRPTRAGIGGITGLGLGIALVALLERFDGRIRRRANVEAATGLPVIAEVPVLPKAHRGEATIIAAVEPRSRIAEAYRVVRSAVLFAQTAEAKSEDGAMVVMVTSPNAGEGKTTTVANLAAVLAEGGLRVLVFNCDFRRPRVHDYLIDENENPESLMTIDCGRAGMARITPTRVRNVRLLTGLGEGDDAVHPLEVVAEQRKIVERTRSAVDVILLDTAPFLVTNDASGLLDQTDQVLVVTRSGKTDIESAERIAEVLRRFDAPTLGVVFNASTEAPSAQYYYGYEDEGVVKQAIPFRGRDQASA